MANKSGSALWGLTGFADERGDISVRISLHVLHTLMQLCFRERRLCLIKKRLSCRYKRHFELLTTSRGPGNVTGAAPTATPTRRRSRNESKRKGWGGKTDVERREETQLMCEREEREWERQLNPERKKINLFSTRFLLVQPNSEETKKRKNSLYFFSGCDT